MPTIDAIIQYGNLPAETARVEEPNILVETITVNAAREKKTYKGINRATAGVSYTDPTISFDFKGYVGTAAGLAIEHPGNLVTELANFAGTRHGFSPADGILVYEDPVDDYGDDPDKISFKVVNYPFVEA